eukprot:15434597-Alexandrium_andersonii.AAC.1
MAESPSGRMPSPSAEAHLGPSGPPQNGRRAMGEDASTQQLGPPRGGAPSRSLRALSSMVRRQFGGGSEGDPVSLRGG